MCALLTFLHLLLPFDSIARCVYLLLQRKKASKHKQNRTRVSVYVCILKIREYLKRCTIVVNTRKGVQKKVTPTSSWLCFPSFCICVCDCVCEHINNKFTSPRSLCLYVCKCVCVLHTSCSLCSISRSDYSQLLSS